MKEEVKRIMRLVQEGKLSPDDAAELIEAFNDAPDETEAVEGQAESVEAPKADATDASGKKEDPVGRFISSIEKIGKDVAKNVNWEDIANQVRQGVNKGVDAVKHAAEEAKKGGGFSVFFGNAQVKTALMSLAVPEGKTLKLDVRNGDIVVEGGHETGSLTVNATFRSYDDAEAQKMADEYVPMLEESDQYVVFKQPEGSNVTTNLIVHVPAGVPLEVKQASGDLKVSGTNASVKADGSSGDVRLSNVTGNVAVSQRSGNVRIEDAGTNRLNVDTKSGNIAVTRATGVIEAKTSSGDVTLTDVKPTTLSVEAASGDISADVSQPVSSAVNITAVSGDVKLGIVDGSDCRVSLSTLRGAVACGFELADMVREGQKVTGRLGEGTGTLDVSVVTGDVSLVLRDSSQT
ncbi:MAG: DUF4097 family beta strand repeat protein [Armatimonadetes bacterium]|nr:DUF4097 family beta strand repeat protein [Armatimonadota bacterium]